MISSSYRLLKKLFTGYTGLFTGYTEVIHKKNKIDLKLFFMVISIQVLGIKFFNKKGRKKLC
jgi:uncharacterized membrane protein YsdA (DUF1294 family)